MTATFSTYGAGVVPDPSVAQASVLGDVSRTVREAFIGLLDVCAHRQPGEAALSLAGVFQPIGDAGDLQSRLKLYMGVRAEDEEARRTLEMTVERSSLAGLYALERRDLRLPAPERPFGAACDVLRRETTLEPLYTEDENALIPKAYYHAEEFMPNDDNDYHLLDAMLDGIDEWVVLHVCVEPADVAPAHRAVTRVAERYQAIGRTWGERPAFRLDEDYFGAGIGPGYGTLREAELPRRRDPLAEALVRKMQDLCDSLSVPNLRFHFRVLAETPETAHTVAAVAAQCAFRDGSYVLKTTRRGDPCFDRLVAAVGEGHVACVASLGSRMNEHEPVLYAHLEDVAHLAAPQELSGAFRWPVGGASSPHCVRQSTDPPIRGTDELIVLGFDHRIGSESSRASARGAPQGFLKKNASKGVVVGGVPGCGKTLLLIWLMLQFYAAGIPFIFFAPILGEQLAIKRYKDHSDPLIRGLARELQIHTPGRDDLSPFQFNPLAWDPIVPFHQHIEGLLECFKGAIPFFPALAGVLRAALIRAFRSHPERAHPPVLHDMLVAAREVLGEMGYQGELLNNLRAALETRLRPLCTGSIGGIFNAGIDNPPMEKLLTGYHLVQMDALNEEQIALLMLFFLKALNAQLQHI